MWPIASIAHKILLPSTSPQLVLPQFGQGRVPVGKQRHSADLCECARHCAETHVSASAKAGVSSFTFPSLTPPVSQPLNLLCLLYLHVL